MARKGRKRECATARGGSGLTMGRPLGGGNQERFLKTKYQLALFMKSLEIF